jgi:hypothetical protein
MLKADRGKLAARPHCVSVVNNLGEELGGTEPGRKSLKQ